MSDSARDRKPGGSKDAVEHDPPATHGGANAASGNAADAAARRMASGDSSPNVATTGDEVDGIPANAVRQSDDDDQIVETTVTEKSRLRTKTTTTAGDKKHVEEHGTTIGKDGVGREHIDQHVEGDKSDKTTDKKAVGLGGYSSKHEVEKRSGDSGAVDTTEKKLGYSGGHFEANQTETHKVDGKDGSHTETSKTGLSGGGQLVKSHGTTDEKKRVVQELGDDGQMHDVTKTSSSSQNTQVGVGKDGASINHARTTKDEEGNSSSTTVGADVGKDHANVNAGKSYTTKGGTTVGGKVHAGIQVHCDDPVEKNGQWVVTYRVTKGVDASASASKGPVGGNVSYGKSSYEEGSRNFKTKKEAEDFKAHAAERIHAEGDATTAKGALELEVGESRGVGHDTNKGAGVSGNREGASADVGVHKTTGDEVIVRRLSDTVFEVTYLDKVEKGIEGHVGGGGVITTGASSTTRDKNAVSAKFDFATPDGKAGFEEFCKHHTLPVKGAFDTSKEKDHRHDTTDGTEVKGLGSASYGKYTERDTITDDQGVHDTISGGQSHEVKTSWLARKLGDKDQSQSVALHAHSDKGKGGTSTSYQIEAHFGGERGTATRGAMNRMAGGGDETFDASKVDKGHSGEWTMTAEVDKDAIANEEKYNPNLKNLKTHDERMQALADEVAERGGKEIGDLNDMGHRKLQWDLELKGDKNFPGEKGRLELEARIHDYATQLAKNPAQAPTVLGRIEADYEALKARHDAVADKSKYLDLPDALRAQQVQMIDGELSQLEALRHQAIVESTKNKPGESMSDVNTRDAGNKYAGSPEQQHVARLRDKMAEADAGIAGYQQQIAEAHAAVTSGAQHVKLSGKNATKFYHRVDTESRQAAALAASAAQTYRGLDEMRMLFLKEAGDPKAAAAIGESLKAQLDQALNMHGEAITHWESAAIGVLGLNGGQPPPGHAAFWKDVQEQAADEGVSVADFEVENSVDKDDAPEKLKPTPMAIR